MAGIDIGISDQSTAQSGASSPISLGGDMSFSPKNSHKELIIIAIVALCVVALVFSKGKK